MGYDNNSGRFMQVLSILLAAFVIALLIQGFNRTGGDVVMPMQSGSAGHYQVGSIKLPETFYFAGERMPLENFDTRESLDREMLVSIYRHSSTIAIIKRANRFFPVIEPILAEYGVPDDFKYLAIAESDLLNLVSPVGATGFWQIMRATGNEYGLEISNDVDERYHLEKATRVACRYLLNSYERYGSWTMAAAAYNGGNRGVDRQIEIQNQTNYYDLLLTEETARYVFRLASYKLIFSDLQKYGFFIDQEDFYPVIPYREVEVDTTVTSFAQFADHFGTTYKNLKYLNPWLRSPSLNNRSGKRYMIKVPEPGYRTVVNIVED
jgi:membrane-bound lytic murein transglycosylase D